MQSEEAGLHAELSRLAEVSAELSRRLTVLRSLATQAGEAEIAQRAQSALPAIDPNAGFGKARAAREAAVRLRREVNAGVRGHLALAKGQLQKLAQQLIVDEKTVASSPPKSRAVPTAAAVRAAAPAAMTSQRTGARVKMQAVVDFNSDNNFFNGFSADISNGGLFVATVNLLPLGTEVDLSFTLPSGERVEARGTVQWVREANDQLIDAFPGMGVQFSALHPAAQSAISQFLAQRDPLFFAEA